MTALLAIALALGALAPPVPVRVLPRPEIPWLVAVAAPRAPAQAEAERRALQDAGGRISTSLVSGVLLVVAEGPPEAEPLVLAAIRALAPGAAVFLEGRVAATTAGALPSAGATPRLFAHDAPPASAAGFTLPLPWSPWLLDDDGEVLRLAVERELLRYGAFAVALDVDAAGARLTITTADGRVAPLDEVRRALRELADRPQPPRIVEGLRAQAAARRARAGSAIGDGARRAALRARWFGAAVALPAADLGVRLRAALLPETLGSLRAATAAPPAP